MLTLKEYLSSAEKAIKKWGVSSMLRDEDAISTVAEFMMKADCDFDGRGTRSGYRMQNAKYAIMILKTKYVKKIKKNVLSIDFHKNEEGLAFSECINDDKNISAERQSYINDMMEKIDSLSVCIPERDIAIVKKYYIQSKTFDELGSEYGLTKEAIRLIVDKTIKKMRGILVNDYKNEDNDNSNSCNI